MNSQLSNLVKAMKEEALQRCFDSRDLMSRPTDAQQAIFNDIGIIQYRYVISGNQSGKSTLAAREISWILNGTHPTWKKPKRWGDTPLLILIAGQSRQQMETELWEKKLRPLLTGPWHATRTSQTLTSAKNEKTGDKIVFLSHADGSEGARISIQGYVANYVWLDEMPQRASILTELQQRVTALGGYLLATFTPLAINAEVKRIVEAAEEPIGKKYHISKLDNPIFSEEKERILKEAAGWSYNERMTRLYGHWAVADSAVYDFDEQKMSEPLPANYSKMWKHAISVDPANSSKTGYVIAGQHPGTKVWYIVESGYILPKDPKAIVLEAYRKGLPYNIQLRASDTCPWFQLLSQTELKLNYQSPWDKTRRKGELIKNSQAMLSSGRMKLVNNGNELLIEEILTCRYSETSEDKIVHHQSYHILDAFQYLVDVIPKDKEIVVSEPKSIHQIILEEDEKRRMKEYHAQKKLEHKQSMKIRRRGSRW